MFTCDFTSAKKMLARAKRWNPSVITLLGGPHITGDPVDTMQDIPYADYGFLGESETSLRELLQRKDKSRRTIGIIYQ